MKTPILVAVALAASAQARESENLEPLFDEMAVLERVLGAALEDVRPGSGLRSFLERTGSSLEPWLQAGVRTVEAEYLVRQGILISLELRREPSVHDVPDALFTTVASTGETRLPKLLAPLEAGDFVELKRLLDELGETRRRHEELQRDLHLELRDANASGRSARPQDSEIVAEMEPVVAKERELKNAMNAEIKRLQGMVETPQETSTDEIHGALLQAVCDYAMLKALPDDEHLTLKVSQEQRYPNRRRGWNLRTYYVLAKQDVVECRQGSIDPGELRQRAHVYTRGNP